MRTQIKMIENGIKRLPVTDERMTRFVITLDEGVDFVVKELLTFAGGEIFVPKLPSIKITDLVEAMLEKSQYNVIGIRPGEKLHEVMIPNEEARNCIQIQNKYIIVPRLSWWNRKNLDQKIRKSGKAVSVDFEYVSNKNSKWLNVSQLKKIVNSSG